MHTHEPRRILIPVDFSPQSRTAVEYGMILAEHFGAEVQLLHVWRSSAIPATWEQLPDLDEFERSRAGEEMKRYLASLEEHGVTVLGRLEDGDPADAIVEVARNERFDLIVMGTHGRTGLSRLLHRHIAEKVVRLAPCPVVTLRAPGALVVDDVVGALESRL